eukprot:530446-Rhodomonas_salina.2
MSILTQQGVPVMVELDGLNTFTLHRVTMSYGLGSTVTGFCWGCILMRELEQDMPVECYSLARCEVLLNGWIGLAYGIGVTQ